MKKAILILASSFLLTNCTMQKYNVDACPKWTNSVKNPDNEEFINEVAFNLNKTPKQVTQQEFNTRYLNN